MKINDFIAGKSGTSKSSVIKYKKQTIGKFPNLLKSLSIIKKEQVVVTDITDISISNHKLGTWLSTFRNRYDDMIMEYAYAQHQRTIMIKNFFNQDIKNIRFSKSRNPLIIHSYNYSQFLSNEKIIKNYLIN